MRLYKLIGLEIEALQADYAETMKNIAIYEDILNNYDSMAEVIMKELDQIKERIRYETPHSDRECRRSCL